MGSNVSPTRGVDGARGSSRQFYDCVGGLAFDPGWTVAGVLQLSGRTGFTDLVKAPADGPMAAAAALLSVLYSLNLLLGSFNLIPVPPLDGFGVLGLLMPEAAMQKLMDLRDSLGMLMILGLLLAWRAFDVIFDPVYLTGLRALYMWQF